MRHAPYSPPRAAKAFAYASTPSSSGLEPGAALAAELGAATADHLETATTEALQLLREAAVQPVLLPGRSSRWAVSSIHPPAQ